MVLLDTSRRMRGPRYFRAPLEDGSCFVKDAARNIICKTYTVEMADLVVQALEVLHAAEGLSLDWMSSSTHHPNDVLIPADKFRLICDKLGEKL